MVKRLRAAVFGSCHAGGLQRVLASEPRLRGHLEFLPLDAVMNITQEGMDDLIAALPSLDLLIYQPTSSDYRGRSFSSAAVLEQVRGATQLLSFSLSL